MYKNAVFKRLFLIPRKAELIGSQFGVTLDFKVPTHHRNFVNSITTTTTREKKNINTMIDLSIYTTQQIHHRYWQYNQFPKAITIDNNNISKNR